MQKQEQQTAVDTLFAEILELLLFKGEVPEHLKEAHRKAKEMEKEQAINDYCEGRNSVINKQIISSEQYYEQTYGDDK